MEGVKEIPNTRSHCKRERLLCYSMYYEFFLNAEFKGKNLTELFYRTCSAMQRNQEERHLPSIKVLGSVAYKVAFV